MFEYVGRCIAHIEENLVERAVRNIAVDQHTQLIRVTERGQRPVNQPYDFAQVNVRRIAAQLVAALGTAHALDNASVLEFEQNQFQELLRKILFIRDVSDPDRTLLILAGEHHHRLQCVQSFLRDLHVLGRLSHKLYLTNRVYRSKGGTMQLSCHFPEPPRHK